MNIKNKGAYILIGELNVTRFADGFNEVYTQDFELTEHYDISWKKVYLGIYPE